MAFPFSSFEHKGGGPIPGQNLRSARVPPGAASSSVPIYGGRVEQPELPPQFQRASLARTLSQRPIPRPPTLAQSLAGRPIPRPPGAATAPPPSSSRVTVAATSAAPSSRIMASAAPSSRVISGPPPSSSRSTIRSTSLHIGLKSQLAAATSFDQIVQLSQSPAFIALLASDPSILDNLAARFHLRQPDPAILRDPQLRWQEMKLNYEYQHSPLQYPELNLQNQAWLSQMIRTDPETLLARLQSQPYQPGMAAIIFELLRPESVTPARFNLLLWSLSQSDSASLAVPSDLNRSPFYREALSYAGRTGNIEAAQLLYRPYSHSSDKLILAAVKAGHNQLAMELIPTRIAALASLNQNLGDVADVVFELEQQADLTPELTSLLAEAQDFFDTPIFSNYQIVARAVQAWLAQQPPDQADQIIPILMARLQENLESWEYRDDELRGHPVGDLNLDDFIWSLFNEIIEADNAELYGFMDQKYHLDRDYQEDALEAIQHGDAIYHYLSDRLEIVTEALAELVMAVRQADLEKVARVLDYNPPDPEEIDRVDLLAIALKTDSPALIQLLHRRLERVMGDTNFKSNMEFAVEQQDQISTPMLKYLLESGILDVGGETFQPQPGENPSRAKVRKARQQVLRLLMYQRVDTSGLVYLIPRHGLREVEYLAALRRSIEQHRPAEVKFLLASPQFAATLGIKLTDYNREMSILHRPGLSVAGWQPDTTVGEVLLDKALEYGELAIIQELIKANVRADGQAFQLKPGRLQDLMTTKLNHDLYLYLLEQRARGRVSIPEAELLQASGKATELGYEEVAGLSGLVEQSLRGPSGRL